MRRLDDGKVQVVEEQAELEASMERQLGWQAELEPSMDGRRDEVNRFSKLIGGTAEEDAADVVEHVARRRGVRLHGEPVAVDLDGDGERSRWARVVDADGDEVSILVKAKARRRADDGRGWASLRADPAFRRSLAERGIEGPYPPYAFGIRIYAEARQAARSVGIGVRWARGEDVAPTPIAA